MQNVRGQQKALICSKYNYFNKKRQEKTLGYSECPWIWKGCQWCMMYALGRFMKANIPHHSESFIFILTRNYRREVTKSNRTDVESSVKNGSLWKRHEWLRQEGCRDRTLENQIKKSTVKHWFFFWVFCGLFYNEYQGTKKAPTWL